MPVLAGQVQGRKTCLVYAVHEAERSKEDLDNVAVAIPSSFVEGCVAELRLSRGRVRAVHKLTASWMHADAARVCTVAHAHSHAHQ